MSLTSCGVEPPPLFGDNSVCLLLPASPQELLPQPLLPLLLPVGPPLSLPPLPSPPDVAVAIRVPLRVLLPHRGLP